MSSKFIYCLIAKTEIKRNIILSDYSDYSGNFQQAAIKLLDIIEKDVLCQIEFKNFTVFYENKNNLTCMVFLMNSKTEFAFTFLDQIRNKFINKYGWNLIQKSFSFAMTDFSTEIEKQEFFYNKHPEASNVKIFVDDFGNKIQLKRYNITELSQDEIFMNVYFENYRPNSLEVKNNNSRNKNETKCNKGLIICLGISIVILGGLSWHFFFRR